MRRRQQLVLLCSVVLVIIGFALGAKLSPVPLALSVVGGLVATRTTTGGILFITFLHLWFSKSWSDDLVFIGLGPAVFSLTMLLRNQTEVPESEVPK